MGKGKPAPGLRADFSPPKALWLVWSRCGAAGWGWAGGARLGEVAALVILPQVTRFTAVVLRLGAAPLGCGTYRAPDITRVACAGLATGFCLLFPLPLRDGSQEEPDIPACPRHEWRSLSLPGTPFESLSLWHVRCWLP